ncbi:MAG: hypothetical protein JO030_01055 [Candidatus Eremiobacteraeota bacterium]|nr:hypothetical protein [Candidatus Eremiobacteraeota bacterium]
MYEAQLYGNDASVYHRKGFTLTFLEKLFKFLSVPKGTKATPDGWWYVANSIFYDVLVYRSTPDGPKGPVQFLQDRGEIPVGVDMTADRELVVVANSTTALGGPGSISVYLSRKAHRSRLLRYGSTALTGFGVALDPAQNCYFSFNQLGIVGGSIVEFPKCNGTGTLVVTAITSAGGLTFDKAGNLYYIDQASGIYKCAGTSGCRLFSTGYIVPLNLNFDKHQKHLWVADGGGFIDAVDPASGKILSRTVPLGGPPFAVAPSPGG